MAIDYSKNWNPKITVKARGRGAGKSYEAARWLVSKTSEQPEAKIAAVVLEHQLRFFVEELVNAAREIGVVAEYQPSQSRVIFGNRGQVRIYSSDNSDSLRGPTFDYLAGDDVEKWPEATYFYAKAACRPESVNRAGMWMNFAGTKSPRIGDLLQNGFDATTD